MAIICVSYSPKSDSCIFFVYPRFTCVSITLKYVYVYREGSVIFIFHIYKNCFHLFLVFLPFFQTYFFGRFFPKVLAFSPEIQREYNINQNKQTNTHWILKEFDQMTGSGAHCNSWQFNFSKLRRLKEKQNDFNQIKYQKLLKLHHIFEKHREYCMGTWVQ